MIAHAAVFSTATGATSFMKSGTLTCACAWALTVTLLNAALTTLANTPARSSSRARRSLRPTGRSRPGQRGRSSCAARSRSPWCGPKACRAGSARPREPRRLPRSGVALGAPPRAAVDHERGHADEHHERKATKMNAWPESQLMRVRSALIPGAPRRSTSGCPRR